ncbi:MAG: GWxTD domain-containing protein [Bacteroidetes bacterium]|jgi:GWxTD domain-containing protein|nr:GWxTD domain-containing protein [Bacteroidota bacterium]
MKTKRTILMLGILGLTITTVGLSQVEMSDRRKTSVATIFMDVLSYASADSGLSKLELYLQVPYEEITFVQKGDEFFGTFDITATISTADGEPVWNRLHTVELKTKDFSQTTSNRLYSLRQMSFDMKPGPFDVRVEVRDQESNKTITLRRKVLVSEFRQGTVSLSDVMLVNRLTSSGDRRNIIPNISGYVGDQADGFFIFYEMYSQGAAAPVRLVATIQNSNRDSVGGLEQIEAPLEPTHQVFMKFGDLNLPIGPYIIRVGAYPVGVPPTDANRIASTSRTFTMRWSDLPFSIVDLDLAVEQMRYVARTSDVDFIRAGETPEDKRLRFLEFWNKRDPDPQTTRNELMEEYYHRVEYANRNFTHYLEGWRTDRGMVYVRFGAPENIERHPFETNSRPYEVWHYYNLNYEFVFVDETGFGDYRLRYPTTDLLGRERPIR